MSQPSAEKVTALLLDIGTASEQGPKPKQEDACFVVEPDADQVKSKGWLLVLADGVSQSADGQMAARSTVRSLASDYYATPATWETAHALDKILTGQNSWLHAQSRDGQPPLTTVTALVLRGRRFTMAHVGDCRLYRVRAGVLELLSEDHIWQHAGYQHVLKRAMGLEQHVVVDFRDGQLQEGDVFALLCDGVWEPLGEAGFRNRLLAFAGDASIDADSTAKALVQSALQAGGQDNASALVLRVQQLPAADSWGEQQGRWGKLAAAPALQAGQQFADWRIDRVLASSRASSVYLARDAEDRPVALKALTPLAAGDEQLARNLLAEAWLLRKAASRYLPELLESSAQEQWLVLPTRWYAGQTLAEKAAGSSRVSVAELVPLALQATRALGGLHRLDILHRDIKPENLHIDSQGALRLLDLGVAYCPTITEEGDTIPGTPSYLAPELLQGQACTVQSDIYALGVSLYYALTRHYPYGEVEAFSHPKFGEAVLPSRYRPDLPQWLESVLLKAVAVDVKERFETCEELHLALELADAKPLPVRRSAPLVQRWSKEAWITLAALSIALNLLLLIYLFRSHAAMV